MSKPYGAPMNYRHEIDGIRAIAVLSVIIAHSGIGLLPGGYAGVDIFFVISGFLITGIILRDLEHGHFSFGNFYARRARRIFPALYFMLITTSVAAWLLLTPSQIQDFSASVFFSVLFLSNGYFLDFVDYFAPSSEYIPLLHTWSLGIEEQFYILFPVIALLAYRLFRKAGLVVTVIILLIASFSLSEWGWRNEPRGNYFFSPSRFWEILLGSIAALWCAKRNVAGNNLLAALGLAGICASFFIYDHTTLFPSFYTLLPTVGAMLLLIYARDGGKTALLLQLPPLRFIGLISFSAYLWHQPIFVFTRILEGDPADPITAAILIGAILAVSALTWHFVEQPFRRKTVGPQRWSWWKAHLLLGSAAGLIALSLAGYFTNLPMARFDANDQKLLEVTRSQANDYQRDIGKPYKRRAFLGEGQAPKVAIIGDSFARDFMNVLNERQILARLDSSFWTISHNCAPFFLPPDDQRLRDIWDTRTCTDYDRYRSPEMLTSIATADIIVLASEWTNWQVPYVVETIDNLGKISSAPIILIGPKGFGTVSARVLLRLTVAERPAFRIAPNTDLIAINDAMQRIEGIHYIDVIGAICDIEGRCPQVDGEGRLISQDGRHLTRAGAILLGEALDQEMRLTNLFRVSLR